MKQQFMLTGEFSPDRSLVFSGYRWEREKTSNRLALSSSRISSVKKYRFSSEKHSSSLNANKGSARQWEKRGERVAVRSIIISMFRLRVGDIYTMSNGLKMSLSQSAGWTTFISISLKQEKVFLDHWDIRRIERVDNVVLRNWIVHPTVMYFEHMRSIRNCVRTYNGNTFDNHVNGRDRDHRDDFYNWACTSTDRRERTNEFDNHLNRSIWQFDQKGRRNGRRTCILGFETILTFDFGIISTFECRDVE